MNSPRFFSNYRQAHEFWEAMDKANLRIVFTNGCFDILHIGHVICLEQARALGNYLVVGLNSDDSIRGIKGPSRPVNPFDDRAGVLAALRSVDLVIGFDQDTPAELIRQIDPQVLVKGGDWPIEAIAGADWVTQRGGQVVTIPLVQGRSTTAVIEKMQRD